MYLPKEIPAGATVDITNVMYGGTYMFSFSGITNGKITIEYNVADTGWHVYTNAPPVEADVVGLKLDIPCRMRVVSSSTSTVYCEVYPVIVKQMNG